MPTRGGTGYASWGFLFSDRLRNRPWGAGESARGARLRIAIVCEHTHIPVSRRTPFPQRRRTAQALLAYPRPFVALSFAAAATTKLSSEPGWR